jgi:hypothetical protein
MNVSLVADSSANLAHKATCAASESTRQNDIAKAISAGGSSATIQNAIISAEKAHYLRIAASALASGVHSAEFVRAAAWVGTHA